MRQQRKVLPAAVVRLLGFVSVALFILLPGIALSQGVPLPANKIPQFVDPLPVLDFNIGTPTGIKTVVAGAGEITLNMLEFQTKMMPSTFVPATGPGTYTGTWVFGYLVGPTGAPAGAVETPVGPVIVATRGVPTQVRYVNNLTANNIFWREWTDQSLHSAFHQAVGSPMPTSGDTNQYMGAVLAVPHLHGGEDPAVVDGGPEAWFASDVPGPGAISVTQGPAYYAGIDYVGGGANPPLANESIYRYPNTQEAAPLWFHDHLLGGTRLNATFAGLAGAYPVIDPALALPAGINAVGLNNGTLDLTAILGPSGANTELLIPLVLQDRMFDTNGQLFFPNLGINPEHPYWVPEFVGDTIIVNGKVWPYLNVDRKRYRFYLIDGSNSRPYEMFLQDLTSKVKGPRLWVISTDGGYLDKPIMIDPNATGQQTKAGVPKSLFMMPGERYEIIVDFGDPTWLAAINAAYTARGIPVPNPLNLVLRNTAPTVDGNPTASLDGRLMQFRVSANAPADASYNPASGIPLRPPMVRLAAPASGTLGAGVFADKTRELTLNEIEGPGGPEEVLVNNSKWMGHRPDGISIPHSKLVRGNEITELPNEGEIEVWEIVNTTVDNHPIHLHGVQFQILNRQAYDTTRFTAAYAAAFPGSATIIDPMTDLPYAKGVFIPGYGPPLDYETGNARALGGNPDIVPFLLGAPVPPAAYEAGWKDTAVMHPGEVTRIAVRFAPQDVPVGTVGSFAFNPSALDGYYVWHCHITDHEDNEMMRPTQFQPNLPDSARTYKQGVAY